MRFGVLGPLVVSARDELPLDRRSHRRLLAILLLERDHPLDTDALADRFWNEEPPPTGRAAIQTHVSQLRRVLGDGLIRTSPHGYRLDLAGHSLDVLTFGELVEQAQVAQHAAAWSDAADAARQALALWRGRPYQELEADPFAAPEIARLDEMRAFLLEARGEALLALGRNEEALPDLEAAVRELPHRERLWEQLMLARVRLGRTADALAAYHDARDVFAEMGLDPGPALRELEERILREDPVLVPRRRSGNLPPRRTTFVGRDREVDEIGDALAAHRLVTLTGTGGSGKTRLAIEVADRLPDRFRDGAWLVDLATLDDPALVTIETAVTLGLRADSTSVEQALIASLGGRQLLVLLDNCEHLLDAAASTAELLLDAGPGVRVLATSRAPLDIADEMVYPVPSLEVPASEPQPLAVVAGYSSVKLFCDRAALVAPGFAIHAENALSVASICRRLDGIPLAIELAAARMAALSPDDVASRLDDRFRLLARSRPTSPARHQTLEATVAWSHDHLSDLQRLLFLRLSVFAGAFGLSSAEDVCAGGSLRSEEISATLAALVEQSLVVPLDTAGGRRYRLLETIRQFARDRLTAMPDAAELHRRHRDQFLRLVGPRQPGSVDNGWVEPLRGQHDDLEAALSWSLEAGEGVEAAVLAAALGEYWLALGHPGRALARLQETLDRADLRSEPEREADVRFVLTDALHGTGHLDAALVQAQVADRLVADRPASHEKFAALLGLASMHLLAVRAEPLAGVEPAREAVAVAEELGDEGMRMTADSTLGSTLVWSGASVDEGIEHKRRALAAAERIGDPQHILHLYSTLITALMLHPELRKTEPISIANEILARFGDDRHLDRIMPWSWLGYAFLESGAWDRTEQVLQRWGQLHLEGFDLTGIRHVRGCLRWMQGRLEDAAAEMTAAIGSPDISPRWYHDVFNLQADVAADRGDLDQVRASAARYLATDVTAAEESMKAAVLSPLVRAEVAAALRAEGAEREKHASRGRDAYRRMLELVERYPHPTGGTVQLETAATHLLIAEAELSRLDQPAPALWERLADQATYVYWKAYAMSGRAEVLLATDAGRGTRALREAHQRAATLGATHLLRQLDDLAAIHGVAPGAPPTGG